MSTYPHHTHSCSLSRARNGTPIAARSIFVLGLALLIYALLSRDLFTDFQGLVAYTLLLLGYLYLETKNLWNRDTQFFWINPVVLASLLTFALPFGLSNVLFFLPEDMITFAGLQPNVTPSMNRLMLLVVSGACAMWAGYYSGAGRNLALMLQRNRPLRKWMSPSVRVNLLTVYVILAISLIARLAAIKLGLYGYSSTSDQQIAAAAYSQFLSMAESFGELALVGAAMNCFASPRSVLLDRQLLWIVFGCELAFGFLSGFKSAVVIPVIIVGLVHYSQRHRFPLWLVPGLVVSVMAAYQIIEPFREVRNADAGFEGTSLGSIATTMRTASNDAYNSGGSSSTLISFLARSNLTYVGSRGVEYAANNELPAGSPEFLNNIILAPVYALIPRVLWDNKPITNLGLWYTNQVMGQPNSDSSTGMGSFTYLNFAGGPLAVLLGFLIVGILQRGLFDGLQGFGGGGLIVLLGLLSSLASIDNGFNDFLITIIRRLPILVVAQYVLLRRTRR